MSDKKCRNENRSLDLHLGVAGDPFMNNMTGDVLINGTNREVMSTGVLELVATTDGSVLRTDNCLTSFINADGLAPSTFPSMD